MQKSLTGVVLDESGDTEQSVQDIELTESEYGLFPLTVTDQNDVPFDLTGYLLIMTVRAAVGSDPLFVRTGDLVVAASGTGQFELLEVDTKGYSGTYYYEVEIKEVATSKTYRVIPPSKFYIAPALYNSEDPVTPVGPDALLVSLPDPGASDVGKAVILLDDDPIEYGYGTVAGGAVYASIAALRAGTDYETFVDGAQVNVNGYYTAGDDGGGAFRWSSASTADDDSATVIKPTAVSGAGRFLRVITPFAEVNVRWFGAKNDLTFDSGPAIQAAIDYVVALTQHAVGYHQGGRVFVPRGDYRSAQTLYIRDSVLLQGEGKYWNSSIYFRNVNASSGTPIDGIVLEVDEESPYGLAMPHLRDLNLYGAGTSTGNVNPSQPLYNGYDPLVGSGSGHAYAAGNGVVIFCRAYIENVSVQGFEYDGFHVDSEDFTRNANAGRLRDCLALQNGRHGIYMKGDNANAWTLDNNNCTANAGWGIYDRSFLGNTYVGGEISDNGIHVGDVNAIAVDYFSSYLGNKYGLVCGSSVQGGFYKSPNRGAQWRTLEQGYQDASNATLDTAVRQLPTRAIVYSAASVFAATPYGVWRIEDPANSDQWLPALVNRDAKALAYHVLDDDMYLGTNGEGVFKSTDDGDLWEEVNTGLGSLVIQCLATDPANSGTVYAGTSTAKVYKTSNGGTSWSQVATGFSSTDVRALAMVTGKLYAGCSDGKVYKTTDGGANWSLVQTCASAVTSISIDPSDTTRVFATTNGSGVYVSTDNGVTWNQRNTGLTHYWSSSAALNIQCSCFDLTGRMYVGSSRDSNVSLLYQTGGVFQSDDAGVTWTQTGTVGALKATGGVKAIGPSATNVFVGTYVESDQVHDILAPSMVLGGILGNAVVGPDAGSSTAPVLGNVSMSGFKTYNQAYTTPVTFASNSTFNTANLHGNESYLMLDATATTCIANVPTPTSLIGAHFFVVRTDASAYPCYLQCLNGAVKFDGATYCNLTAQWDFVHLVVTSATNYHIVSRGNLIAKSYTRALLPGGSQGRDTANIVYVSDENLFVYFDGTQWRNLDVGMGDPAGVADENKVVSDHERLIRYTSLSMTRTVTLPTPSAANKFKEYVIKDETGNASGSVKITVAGVEGGTAEIATAYGKLRLYNNGTTWFLV